MKKGCGCSLAILGIVVIVGWFVVNMVLNWKIDNEIVAWKARAQVVNEPKTMVVWLTNVQAGMINWKMTEGHSNWLFPTPENDMALVYQTLSNHIEQANRLIQMNPGSPEYQTGLDNLRGGIRELDLHATEYYFWNLPGVFFSTLAIFISMIIGAGGVLFGLRQFDFLN